MAHKKSGAFSKMLEVIGLVDDEENMDTMDNGYAGDQYGRQQTYVPQRSRASSNRSAARYEGQSGRRSPLIERVDELDPYQGRNTRGQDRYSASAQSRNASRPASRFAAEPARASRFNDAPQSRFAQDEFAPASREPRNAQRSRTVMFSLRSLEDCCDVIDDLISNNTVVLTLDELDPKMTQRAVDTLSGAVFALHATIRKASDRTYLIAPASVEVNESDDIQRRY